MTLNIEIAPYQNIKVFDDLIRVDVQAASLPGLLCELSKIRLTFYHLYLNKNNYSKDAYFNGIESMLTVDDIVKNGNMVGFTHLCLFKRLTSEHQNVFHRSFENP